MLHREAWTLAATSTVAVLATVAVPVDLAVAATAPNNPYSPLWFLLNPLYTTQAPYRLYLATFAAVSLAFCYRAVQRGTLPWNLGMLQALGLAMVAFSHWHENTTVVAYAWLAWYTPSAALIAAQKLPFGWSLDLADAHYRCLDACYAYPTAHPAGLLGVFWRDIHHYVAYALVLLLVLAPLVARQFAKRHTPKATP